ncbi:Dot/Icm T4SS effector VpdC [Legionella waltersii]|uniref:Esterase of the alpha-beta hydrolase superfamily protein n=1 Tax=Legionella waltersii TaxID=66969 RepID=A0A0W1ALX5_9GAMM|nr:Dot/Icm T4SS effector VpdC [Legionella waltersii]KTD82274.1 esterase of the alpha-beta hydrolase superfamily protein [Legionella waltersii]SNV04337.1 esterase of the alpha-beta hydrolase superfamily [Legionella waltersii]
MTPQHVITQLLQTDTKYPKNLNLLKKIILSAYLGRLRINGLAPDNKVSLANYLFDNEKMIFDFTRLSENKRIEFDEWLLGEHQNDKQPGFLSGVYVNDYRGFTAEVALSWWGVLKQWLFSNKSEHWNITDLEFSLNYQLTGIEMFRGKNGILIGFNQFLVPPSGTKYCDPNHYHQDSGGNTKRIYITNALVDQLRNMDYAGFNYETACKSSHPHAIDVLNYSKRFKEMQDYRRMQRFTGAKAWYLRLWEWITSFFNGMKSKVDNPTEKRSKQVLLYKDKTVKIYQNVDTKEILVSERRPDITNLVFCGGGAKIFAHLGVWRALNEAGIKPTKFAGSSAGAIIALMCYMGYTADEINQFFKEFKQETIVKYDISTNGLSDSHSLKTALDFIIAKKVSELSKKYKFPFPTGKITFSTLDSIRKSYPDCGIGDDLIVTATNKRLGKTSYFSTSNNPTMEISEAVKMSSSFPVLYKHTIFDGHEHSDGGVLSNFPTEVFEDDGDTLLESEFGNNLKVLAVQFDNGTERSAIDRIKEKVYRENFLLNWIYGLITGVSDPASGWERDRLKLRQYAMQTIVIDTMNISSTGFNIEDKVREQLIQNGYKSTIDYLSTRYSDCGEKGKFVNKELMYSTFNSLSELLSYCCYRGSKYYFEIVNDLIVHSTLPNRTSLSQQSLELNQLYFQGESKKSEPTNQRQEQLNHSLFFFGNNHQQCHQHDSEVHEKNHRILLALYQVFLKLSPQFVIHKKDKATLDSAKHAQSLHHPFTVLDHLNNLIGDAHILVHIVAASLKELKEKPTEEAFKLLDDIAEILYSNVDLMRNEYFGKWDLSISQCSRVLKMIKKQDHQGTQILLECLKHKLEPMQTVQEGHYIEDYSDWNSDPSIMNFSL